MKRFPKEMRTQQRCVKDVGMHCSFLHENANQFVTVRNFSNNGLYFESDRQMQPGALIVLRSMNAADHQLIDAFGKGPQFSMNADDPPVCTTYKSHLLAVVRRCSKLEKDGDKAMYGIGAKIQIFTD